MKKFLLTFFLLIVASLPTFAQNKGNLGFNLKAGIGFSSNLIFNNWYFSEEQNENYYLRNDNNFVSIEAELYYYIFKNLSVGFGANHYFASKISDMNYDYTNVFFTIKPEAQLNSKIFSSVYGVGKIGYGIINTSGTFYGDNLDIENGVYIGLGIGTTIKSFIIECMYSINHNKINNSIYFDFSDLKYTTFILNIGYRFNIINN